MSHQSCCVVGCRNTGRKSDCKFYSFSTAKWKENQREKWIAAVRRINEHFIGGKKSDAVLSPSFVPTIFPAIYKTRKVSESTIISRYKRLITRKIKKKSPPPSTSELTIQEPMQVINECEPPPIVSLKVDQECQVDFYSSSDVNSHTFICNRYITNNLCHAETQTEIVVDTRPVKIHVSNKKFVNKKTR
ncbi:uncharacterized protein LOC113385230 isoform X2 [Ctenocephalides felis]|uniref:uncharacterized protein LOC113385230 isoform X2 n=1 Tax=Ctenocephalides felis TaxID=7515 RepID=UPI000E6E244B|nr:uncharacterized protein LOC113385230 isoform X2 [Ctenocephalides felis]